MGSTYKIECQRLLIDTLEALLSSRIGVVEASRAVCSARSALQQETNPLFTPFVAIESETDQFPLGQVRTLWASEAVARYDQERMLAEQHYSVEAMQSASALLVWARSQKF